MPAELDGTEGSDEVSAELVEPIGDRGLVHRPVGSDLVGVEDPAEDDVVAEVAVDERNRLQVGRARAVHRDICDLSRGDGRKGLTGESGP